MEERRQEDHRRPTWIPIARSPKRLVIRHSQHRPAILSNFSDVVVGVGRGGGGNNSSPLSPPSRSLFSRNTTIRPAAPPENMFFHVTPATKRRQEDTTIIATTTATATTSTESTIYRENRLIHLCRASQWSAVLQRCRAYPEEAFPHRLGEEDHNQFNLQSYKRRNMEHVNHLGLELSLGGATSNTNSNNISDAESDDLFHDTALGIACACPHIDTEELRLVIEALVAACPDQVLASQIIPGHTPLRDAIKNRNCTREILKILLNSQVAPRILKKDRDGLYPIDYLIMGVQLGTPKQSLELLQDFIKAPDLQYGPTNEAVSPLIRLLTLGTSFGLPHLHHQHHHQQRSVPIDLSPWSRNKEAVLEDVARISRVLNCSEYLLEANPSLISECSRATGCSPLHVALRNYGNYPPLIKHLMNYDSKENSMMKLRNHYGDLPLHVACSVGVPMEILHLVLQRTVAAVPSHTGGPHPLAWSVNQSGYTPIDLEWVRHIESGKGFYAARSFYPLDVAGVRKHCRKQDGYYKDLLEEAVSQVVTNDLSRRTSSQEDSENGEGDGEDEFFAHFSKEDEAKSTFGMLIDRFQILVQAAAFGLMLPLPSKDPSKCNRLLHATAKLSQPFGPSLPLPLLHLSLWLHREQIEASDENQRLPIHYAVRGGNSRLPLVTPKSNDNNNNNGLDWKLFIQTLLKQAPATAQITDEKGRLPLHLALDANRVGGPITQISSDKDSSITHARQILNQVVQTLVEYHPDSVDSQDPTSNLYPFMMAAADPALPLETVYFLLRRSPSRCGGTYAGR